MIENGCAQRAAEMAPPLAPVEARPAQRTAAAIQPADIDTGALEEILALARQPQLVAAAEQQPARHKAVEHLHRQIAGQMVVAGPRAAQLRVARPGANAQMAGPRRQR